MPAVEVLSPFEVAQLEQEISQAVGEGRLHPNDAINSLLQNFTGMDNDSRGRQIIDYKTYLRLHEMHARMDGYAMRYVDTFGRTIVLPAGKHTKWLTQEYKPLEDDPPKRRSRADPALQAESKSVSSDMVAFKCAEKYPGCPRFFDNLKGLQFHWKREHEGVLGKKKVKD